MISAWSSVRDIFMEESEFPGYLGKFRTCTDCVSGSLSPMKESLGSRQDADRCRCNAWGICSREL